MRKWVHRLTEIDPIGRTAVCSNCGPVGTYPSGKYWVCRTGAREAAHRSNVKKAAAEGRVYLTRGPDGPRHILTLKNTSSLTAICSECGPVPMHFVPFGGRWVCGPHFSFLNRISYQRRNGHAEPESRGEREAALIAQGYKCALALCLAQIDMSSANRDHSHDTGVFRGFTCWNCNIGMGQFDDNAETMLAAADYLERPRPILPMFVEVIHSLTDEDYVTRTAVCSVCGPVNIRCSHKRWWVCINHDRWQKRASQQRIHGHNPPEQWGERVFMLEAQNYECPICSKAIDASADRDHDHSRKKDNFRAYLCSKCNRGLGEFHDNTALIRQAAAYLVQDELIEKMVA